MNCNFAIRRLFAILVIAGLALAPVSRPVTAETASDGKLHNLDFACSEIQEIKKNGHVASPQGGFHVRTLSDNFNFVPQNPSAAIVSALSSACSK